MKSIAIAAGLVSAVSAETPVLSPAEQAEGFRLLFDGKSLENFRNYKSDKITPAWQIRDGALVMTSDEWKTKMATTKFSAWEKFNKMPEGHIVFQDHGSPISFRNLRIKAL